MNQVLAQPSVSGNGPIKLKIVGMDCGSCALTIESSMRQLPGVSEASVSFTTETMEVTGEISRDAIEARRAMVQIETNIDDMNPEILPFVLEQLLGAGALDAYLTPVQMKKGRPGTLITVLAAPGDADRLERTLFRETHTLGVRRRL